MIDRNLIKHLCLDAPSPNFLYYRINSSDHMEELYKEEEMVKGKIVKTDGYVEDKEWPTVPSLEEMQRIVGGYIERVTAMSLTIDEEYEVIANEDGLMLGLSFNEAAKDITGYTFFGDILIFSGTPMKDEG